MTRIIPVRTICAMYGLNPNTLRSWERRYGIVSPVRSDGGHRGYTARDVDAIELMLRYMGEGKSAAAAADVVLSQMAEAPSSPRNGKTKWSKDLHRAIDRLDVSAALNCSRMAIETFGYDAAVEQILFPELVVRGDVWDKMPGGVAREHLASLVVRFVIMQRQLEVIAFDREKTVTLACAPGEGHDLPLLHTANLLYGSGVATPLVLTAGLPLEDVVEASNAAGSRFVLISATMTPRSTTLREWVETIIRGGWEERTLLAGPGFETSRVFSESRIKAAPGDYSQVVTLFQRLLTTPQP